MVTDKQISFKNSLDKTAYGVTVGVTILFALLTAGPFFLDEEADIGLSLSLGIALSLIYFITYGYSPKKYLITTEKLIIVRFFKNVEIKRNNMFSFGRLSIHSAEQYRF